VVERIGIFGGTFDPPHTGHVMVAAEVRHVLHLDRVCVVVAGEPWQKTESVCATARDRLALTRLAFDGVDGIEVLDLEVERPGPSYTIDTVEALARRDRELVVVLGADAAARVPTWHRAQDLAARVVLAIVTRAGGTAPSLDGFNTVHVDTPTFEVSSSDVRARLASGAPIDGLLPPQVIREVRARRLYTAVDVERDAD
jgi:nicotinate-nucleotide adenylyltransferase